MLVDVQDSPVETDEKRPSRREWLVVVDHTIGPGHGLGGIAQQRIVDAQRLGEGLVRLGGVDADREVRDVEAPDFFTTLTE